RPPKRWPSCNAKARSGARSSRKRTSRASSAVAAAFGEGGAQRLQAAWAVGLDHLVDLLTAEHAGHLEGDAGQVVEQLSLAVVGRGRRKDHVTDAGPRELQHRIVGSKT